MNNAIEIIINYLIKKNHTHIAYINISEKYNFAQ